LLEQVPDRFIEHVKSLLLHCPVASPQLAFGRLPGQAGIPPLGVGLAVGCGVAVGFGVGFGVGLAPAPATKVQPPLKDSAYNPVR
jgi:hypothetical protein